MTTLDAVAKKKADASAEQPLLQSAVSSLLSSWSPPRSAFASRCWRHIDLGRGVCVCYSSSGGPKAASIAQLPL